MNMNALRILMGLAGMTMQPPTRSANSYSHGKPRRKNQYKARRVHWAMQAAEANRIAIEKRLRRITLGQLQPWQLEIIVAVRQQQKVEVAA